MISYIFKNKTKNILAIVFTALYMVSCFFSNITKINSVGAFFAQIVDLLPMALILTYLLILKKEYQFKQWLFPASFAINALLTIVVFTVSIPGNLEILKITDGLQGIYIILGANILNVFSIIAAVFCFAGSLFNFKNVKFLRLGMLIFTIIPILTFLLEFISAGGLAYWQNIEPEYFTIALTSHIRSIMKFVIRVLYCFGLFNLTLNKVDENIDTI